MAKKPLFNPNESGLHIVMDSTEDLVKAIALLTKNEVLVGFPEETTDRDDPASAALGITNAALGYIHDNGAPEQHIPARPFMEPGMARAVDDVTDTLARAAEYALASKPEMTAKGFDQAGLQAVKGIQTVIREGIAPALADSTLRARAAKGRKGAAKELGRRERGLAPGMFGAIPLMDTNEMLKSVSYVVRNRNQRGK